VQITNGLDEGLHLAAQAARLHAPDFEAIVVEPAFEMYAVCIAAAGGRQVTVLSEQDLSFPLRGVLAAITPKTGLIYVCDPNNPSGLGMPPGAIAAIAQTAPGACVFVDEAYAEFSGRTFVGPGLERFRNVVVGRTFAKAYGLAALRAGAVIGHPNALAPLRAVMPPFSVNVAALAALQAALADSDYVAWYVQQSAESRERIYDWCRSAGFRCWPSEGNFVLIEIGHHASALCTWLAGRGIFIRDKSRQPGCAGCVRITAGIIEDTRVCIDALEAWRASQPR
jgi:histidinol-phosphate aminotransferase